MSDQINGWSTRKKTFTMGGTLGAIASLVTIVSFLTGHSNLPPPPNPGQTSPASSVSSTGPALPTGPASPTGSAYPVSAQNSVLSNCEQNYGEPPSYCQCDLNWLEANYSYSTFVQDPATFEQQADSYASCPSG